MKKILTALLFLGVCYICRAQDYDYSYDISVLEPFDKISMSGDGRTIIIEYTWTGQYSVSQVTTLANNCIKGSSVLTLSDVSAIYTPSSTGGGDKPGITDPPGVAPPPVVMSIVPENTTTGSIGYKISDIPSDWPKNTRTIALTSNGKVVFTHQDNKPIELDTYEILEPGLRYSRGSYAIQLSDYQARLLYSLLKDGIQIDTKFMSAGGDFIFEGSFDNPQDVAGVYTITGFGQTMKGQVDIVYADFLEKDNVTYAGSVVELSNKGGTIELDCNKTADLDFSLLEDYWTWYTNKLNIPVSIDIQLTENTAQSYKFQITYGPNTGPDLQIPLPFIKQQGNITQDLVLFLPGGFPADTDPTAGTNWIKTKTFTAPNQVDFYTDITYYDGLG
ncbi:MAG: hypothetical protein LUF87_07880, partial [Alistipes sp.]|nr:hypothetical protein [Alistipes sp.]